MPTPSLVQDFERIWGRKPILADAPVLSLTAEYQDRFLREQSPRTKYLEWEDRIIPRMPWSEIASIAGFILFLVVVVVGTHL